MKKVKKLGGMLLCMMLVAAEAVTPAMTSLAAEEPKASYEEAVEEVKEEVKEKAQEEAEAEGQTAKEGKE